MKISCDQKRKVLIFTRGSNNEYVHRSLGWGMEFVRFFQLIFRERGRKGGREKSMCGCLSHALCWGNGPPPRHVPRLGIEPATPFGSQAGIQSTEPHQPGLFVVYEVLFCSFNVLILSYANFSEKDYSVPPVHVALGL